MLQIPDLIRADHATLEAGPPLVSVIVLAHRSADALDECLRALYLHRCEASFEVIAVSNGATDDVRGVLAEQGVARVVHSVANRGFAGGCNLGASHARGQILVFLNDDAVISDNWLAALLHVLATRPEVGVVGSLVLDANERVLEFGARIDETLQPRPDDRGRLWPDEVRPGVRLACYASGCSVAVRRELFERIGGFDPDYYPAYFEDVDLSWKAWRAGSTVAVTSASIVHHREGASTNTNHRRILHEINAATFAQKWGQTPCPHPPEVPEHVAPVVLIDDFLPQAQVGSGLSRSQATAVALTEAGTPLLIHARNDVFRLPPQLRARGVHHVPDEAALHRIGQPRAVIASRPNNFALAAEIAAANPGTALIYDAEARYSARLESALALADPPQAADEIATDLAAVTALETSIAERADLVVAICPSEADWFAARGAAHVQVLDPFPVRCEFSPDGFRARERVTFLCGWLGGAQTPNGDGVRWLATEVVPQLAVLDPSIVIEVTGGNPPASLLALAGPQLRFIGEVPDLDRLLDESRLVVAAVRYGAGVKIKVIDALARAVPVVTTSVGAAGVATQWSPGMVVADDPADFAAAIHSLSRDESQWDLVRGQLATCCEAHRNDPGAQWSMILDLATQQAQRRRQSAAVLRGGTSDD